ncbi:MAG: tetratricopeptide repeat protein [Candidatus Edwardsbacteria bacterium]|nr:tetratricopeptide repeat protein [Candidatus Edwardsbacteria bacterium]
MPNNNRHINLGKRTGFVLMLAMLAGNSGCAYFNTYYNAQKLYNSASRKHQQFPDTTAATSAEKEELKKAIDKYADVALRHPNSRWVVPSLYNMGNAYYLRGEYDKAARKYQEIWQYYPESKYSPRAQLNNALISQNLKQWDKALWELSQIKTDDGNINQRAAYLEALILQAVPDYPKAIISWERFLHNHYKSDLAVEARYNYARCLFSLNEFSNSIRELEMILDSRIKRTFRYQVTMLLGQAYQANGRHSRALPLYRRLLRRESDKGRISAIELEILNCQRPGLTAADAAGLYHGLAQKYPKTAVSSEALFKIGQIHEAGQELDSALAYYNKARNENPAAQIREAALKKSADISLLLAYRQQSDQQAAEQSAKLQFLMAEHYLFGLNKPDSALAVYRRVAGGSGDNQLAPKAWYAAAWTARNYLSDTLSSDSLFYILIEKYPRTRYANGARLMLNQPVDTTVIDTEPEIEMNIRPLEQKPEAPPARPDSAQAQPPDSVAKDAPSAPLIPGPNINRSMDTR